MITLEEITRKYMRAFPEKFTELPVVSYKSEFSKEVREMREEIECINPNAGVDNEYCPCDFHQKKFDEELITLGEMDAKKNFESLRRDRDMLMKLNPEKYA